LQGAIAKSPMYPYFYLRLNCGEDVATCQSMSQASILFFSSFLFSSIPSIIILFFSKFRKFKKEKEKRKKKNNEINGKTRLKKNDHPSLHDY